MKKESNLCLLSLLFAALFFGSLTPSITMGAEENNTNTNTGGNSFDRKSNHQSSSS